MRPSYRFASQYANEVPRIPPPTIVTSQGSMCDFEEPSGVYYACGHCNLCAGFLTLTRSRLRPLNELRKWFKRGIRNKQDQSPSGFSLSAISRWMVETSRRINFTPGEATHAFIFT